MNNAPQVLRELSRLGVHITAHGDRLHYQAPPGVMTADRLEQLRTVKQHVLELLGEEPTYTRAPRRRWCRRCVELEARGIAVLLCSECDRRIHDREEIGR